MANIHVWVWDNQEMTDGHYREATQEQIDAAAGVAELRLAAKYAIDIKVDLMLGWYSCHECNATWRQYEPSRHEDGCIIKDLQAACGPKEQDA